MPEKLGGEKIWSLNCGSPFPIYKMNWNGKNIAVCQTLIGSAGTVGIAEEIHSLGANKLVLFGSCGTLDSSLTAGHLIVPTEAYRDEGTSYHYMAVSNYIKIQTADKLAEILDEFSLPYVKGKTWTTDAIYRETRNNVNARKNEGCITVEMECAAFMAFAAFRNIEVYQYLYAEDNLDCEEWERRTMGSVHIDIKERYLRIALDTAAKFAE